MNRTVKPRKNDRRVADLRASQTLADRLVAV